MRPLHHKGDRRSCDDARQRQVRDRHRASSWLASLDSTEVAMKTLLRGTASVLLLLSWAGTSLAQTADEIIEKNLTASGGRAAIAALKSRVMTGAITLSTPVGDLAGTI